MSTDLLEKPEVKPEPPKSPEEIEQERLMSYQPPPIFVNDDVCWYRDCNTSRDPFYGRVVRVGSRVIEIWVSDASMQFQIKDGVRFKEDPMLAVNANHRASGCWDYTKRHKDVEDLKTRVAVLESLFDKKK